MDRYPNYDAFKAAHEARAQQVRVSAVAAGITRRQRRPRRRLSLPGSGSRDEWLMSPSHSPETLFWA